PSSIQNKLGQVGGKGFGGAFAMGLVGGLIAAPCTGPFLLGLLTFVATTHDVLGGGSLLFVYALGMGVLFWALAAFAMALPKSGAWMEHGKSLGGVLLLFAAVYFVRPLVPQLRDLASPELWFAGTMGALVVIGIALGAIHKSFHGALVEKLRKATGVVLMVAGASGLWLWYDTPKHDLAWINGDEKLAFETARAQGKGVLVDFGASWCGACHDIERTFGDKDVNEAITADFIPLHFDVSDDTEANTELKARYGVATLPGVVFWSLERGALVTIRQEVSVSEMLARVHASARGLRGEVVAKCD
nr:thioredoxin family protein [Kofleriaceae bacterium]